MFDLLRKIIEKRNNSRGIAAADPDLRTRLAAAVILLEAAHADNDCTEEEFDHVLETLKTTFALSHEYAEELMELAHQEREQALDLWQFTNHINQLYNKEEKIEVMEAVWRIIHADGRLEAHEDHFAHKLANLLRLTHREMIDAKIRARGQASS